jgi:hypothetical protein
MNFQYPHINMHSRGALLDIVILKKLLKLHLPDIVIPSNLSDKLTTHWAAQRPSMTLLYHIHGGISPVNYFHGPWCCSQMMREVWLRCNHPTSRDVIVDEAACMRHSIQCSLCCCYLCLTEPRWSYTVLTRPYKTTMSWTSKEEPIKKYKRRSNKRRSNKKRSNKSRRIKKNRKNDKESSSRRCRRRS